MEAGTPLPVVITVFADKSFTFVMKTPPASFLIKKAAGVKAGSKNPNKDPSIGKITMADIRKIAETKMPDLNAASIEMAMKTIEGSARSMGLDVVEA